jgi:hypothetical protein
MVTKLLEGGNIFKQADGSPATTRIARDNIVPTVQWLEQLTGLNLVDNMLGSTGKKESSGDLDLGVDSTKVTKEVLIQQLLNKGIDRNDIRKTGDSVHLKTPILGDANNGYVQTDFMFSDNPAFQSFSYAGAGEGQFKGVHRNILLASIAKAQGLKWSPKFGLVNRETNEVITDNPNEIAKQLVNGSSADLSSVEAILNKIKSHPNYEQLVADARDAFARDNLVLPESSPLPGTGAWFRAWRNRDI